MKVFAEMRIENDKNMSKSEWNDFAFLFKLQTGTLTSLLLHQQL